MGDDIRERTHSLTALHERRERVFLVFAGLFVGAMGLLNVIGITKFIRLGSIPWPAALSPAWLGAVDTGVVHHVAGMTWHVFHVDVAAGVLAYPITFLCTDFISEFYGRRRANRVVLVGLLVNAFVIAVLWAANRFPATDYLEERQVGLLADVYFYTRKAVVASMAAYLAAQFCDVFLFHFWKRLTRGKHLWLRNNGSTMISQLVDTVSVVMITFYAAMRRGEISGATLAGIIVGSYMFKMLVALIDTIPFYVGVRYLGRYLRLDPSAEHGVGVHEAGQ